MTPTQIIWKEFDDDLHVIQNKELHDKNEIAKSVEGLKGEIVF